MRKLLFIISLLLFTGWIAGVFLFKAPSLIHILPVLAGIVYIRSLICRQESTYLVSNNK